MATTGLTITEAVGDSKWGNLYEKSRDLTAEPVVLCATVVHGFKRGSKELGIPTANLSMDELGQYGESLETGVYYGWAEIVSQPDQGKTEICQQRFKTVVSVGWNPYYNNTNKTVEAHLLAKLEDFYGATLNVTLFGYLRPEANFNSLDELIDCIQTDINITEKLVSI